MLGYNRITSKSNGESDSESDMSYGIGFEVNKGTNVKLHVEWLVLHDDNYNFQWLDNSRIDYNLKISSINANLSWYF
ncbi:hypothetical protein [Vibrio natriegens]|uniref:hypothetical protein n=1 Tax=Vibrio natriegens TaxID=691 RepID=UPI0012DB4240